MNFTKIEEAIRKRMAQKNIHEEVVAEFLHRVKLVSEGFDGKIPWGEIEPLQERDTVRMEELSGSDPAALKKLVVIKLNGGLGTSMGLSGPKSLLPVRGEKNFLQIMLEQVRRLRERSGHPVPLVFMNSYSTRDGTLAYPEVRDINGDLPADFLQNMVPRLARESLTPIGDGASPDHWCPPGHGDIYLAMRISGMLDRLLEQGARTAFISNGDNLSATVDEGVLGHFLRENLDFAMEITPKTKADLKGGALFRRNGASVELLETAQVEEEHIAEFQDIGRFAHFNTNNLWVHLESLRDALRSGNMRLLLIVNPKQVAGTDIVQLETAMGSAIGQFGNTRGIIVPRSRFSPVKSCADLLVRQSDACTLRDSDLALIPNLADFQRLFPKIPSLVDVESFQVEGNILFDKPIIFKGKIHLKYNGAEPFPISRLNREHFEDSEMQL